ncbi:MAG TPA: hypothetical protein PL045_07675, partial [Chitinophagaceae bacterium]|nr:hypothetical protein [Chitinophagaceae bacterium]
MNARIIVLFCFAVIFFARCTPLKNVTRPADWLPEVEVLVNSTIAVPSPQQIDDYVTTSSYIPCTIRLMNASTTYFPAGYDVQIRNIAIPSTVPVHGGRLTFSSTGVGAGAATLNVTLPADGSWFTFYIQGTTISTQDKDAIIEVIENRPADDEIIVARKSLRVTNTIPAVPSAKLKIVVNGTSTIDDYLTWSPMQCFINVTNPGPDVPADVNVTIQNMPGTNKLRFAADDGTIPGFTTTAASSSINITVPASGTSVRFYVAGFFDPAAPSSNSRGSAIDKDAVLEVVQTGTGTLLGREGMMVRIRKDANNLTAEERDRFLNAIMMSHVSFNRYVDFFQMHRNNDPVG